MTDSRTEALDHRLLQRTLFRMQMDPGFAISLRRDDARVEGLGERELQLLRELPVAGIEADRGGVRRRQVVGNVASEFEASVAHYARLETAEAFLDHFLSSEEFHAAMSKGQRLPLAFGAYAARSAGSDELASELARLELALVELRRADRERPVVSPARGTWLLTPRARLLALRGGVLGYAESLRSGNKAASFDAAPQQETVLLHADGKVLTLRLREVRVELLQGPVATLLAAARQPLDEARRLELASELGASPEELRAFGEELVTEGLLLHG